MATNRLERIVRAEPSALPPLTAALAAFAAANGIPASAAFKIELAIDELVNNAIDHGYAAGPPGEIRLTVTRRQAAVTIDYSDDAPLFDPFAAAVPDTGLPIEQRSPRGLGIHLVRTLMTNSRYSVLRRKNHIRLTLALDETA